jgi:hypothetical protein
MRGLLLLALLALAGCKPAQVALGVPPGFYPSAVAHDPVGDRFFVASYATGAIAVVRQDGTRIGMVRPEEASHPVRQLAYDAKARRLWALTADAVEAVEPGTLPVRRAVVARTAPGGRFADIAAGSGSPAFVLDAASGAIVVVDPDHGTARTLARLPDSADEGALTLLPDRSTLVVARGGALWRVAVRTGAIEPIALDAPLADVSQLVAVTSDAVTAFRGRANEVVTLRLAPDARRATLDAGTRVRYDTPFHGVADGRHVLVLLGRLRHHPDFGGDGRPNLPPRLAIYAPPPRAAVVAASTR